MGKGRGKGEGRGGCGLLDNACDAIQSIAACICCLLFSGPILLIVGVYFIISAFSDGRGDRIDEYNATVQGWQNGGASGFGDLAANPFAYTVATTAPCTSPAGPQTLSAASSPVIDLGAEAGESDFDSYTPIYFEDDTGVNVGAAGSAASACTGTFTITRGTDTVTTFTVPLQEEVAKSFQGMGCQRTTSGGGSKSARERNDVARCQQVCQQEGGRPSGNSYLNYRCDVTQPVTEVCVRVTSDFKEATGSLPDSTGATGPGCYLGFGGQTWSRTDGGTAANGLTLTVRSERDPELYFLDISKGTRDFGLATSEKLSIGFTCLILGAIITACVCGACCMIAKYARGGNNKPRPSNPVTGPLYDVANKYGNYIPGGHAGGQAVGQPVHGQNVQMGGQMGSAPAGYPTKPGTSGAQYAAPPQQYAAPPQYGAGQTQYGAPPQYGAAPTYGQPPAGQQPAGYPSV